MKSCLKYHGGKYYLAPWIVGKISAPHKLYVEPYYGTGAVMLEKAWQGVGEVANDIDGNLMCFWHVLQQKYLREILLERLMFTPISKPDFDYSLDVLNAYAKSPYRGIENIAGPELMIERACAFFIVCRQSMSGRMNSFAPLSKARIRRGMLEQVAAFRSAVDEITPVAERMMRVAIFNDPAEAVIEREDSKDTLFYLDPPYYPDSRVSQDVYRHEMTHEQHASLLSKIKRCKGKVAISGYRCDLYDYELSEWNRCDVPVAAHCSTSDIKATRIECLWRNFTC